MAVRNKIKRLVDTRCKSVYEFWQRTGVSRNTAYLLYNNPDQYPSAEVMDSILTAFGVTPNDVIEQVPDD